MASHSDLPVAVSTSKTDNMIWLVGAGLGRTGTNSLCLALKELGYNPHHMHVFSQGSKQETTPENINEWYKLTTLSSDELRNVDWDSILAPIGYTATTDWPSANYWEYIYDYYSQKLDEMKKSNAELPPSPSTFTTEASVKVILTIRSNSEQWWQSVFKAIWPWNAQRSRFFYSKIYLPLMYLIGKRREYNMHQMASNTVWNENGFFKNEFLDGAKSQRKYESHNRSVVDTMNRKNASKQLLIFETGKHGYKELCKFLEISENNIPKNSDGNIDTFPRSNHSGAKSKGAEPLRRTNTIGIAAMSILSGGALATAIYYLYPSFRNYSKS